MSAVHPQPTLFDAGPFTLQSYEDALCADCSAPTCPGEWYMVVDGVWREALAVGDRPDGGPVGFLCIGCLEARLGRRLVAADFAPLPVNEPSPADTGRLATRKGRWS
jgi:hypothetical protein